MSDSLFSYLVWFLSPVCAPLMPPHQPSQSSVPALSESLNITEPCFPDWFAATDLLRQKLPAPARLVRGLSLLPCDSLYFALVYTQQVFVECYYGLIVSFKIHILKT